MQVKGYFNQHKKILVAVSGGADSMSLLHFLYNHQKDLDIQLGIAHVNHKQRQESEHEEAYLRHWAEEHKVPFHYSEKGPYVPLPNDVNTLLHAPTLVVVYG